MNLLPWLTIIWLFFVGLYGVATSKSRIHLVNCLFVMQSSTYLLLLTIGFRYDATAPILKDVPPGTVVVDPVVQALTLTDIVVSAAVSALLLVFTLQIHKNTGSTDPGDRPTEQG